jgi:hypothetical protein
MKQILTPMIGDIVFLNWQKDSYSLGVVADMVHNGRTCEVYWFRSELTRRYESQDLIVVQRV